MDNAPAGINLLISTRLAKNLPETADPYPKKTYCCETTCLGGHDRPDGTPLLGLNIPYKARNTDPRIKAYNTYFGLDSFEASADGAIRVTADSVSAAFA